MTDSTASFLAARDFLLTHRLDHERAYRDFQWPVLGEFNWALDHFDILARGNEATALHIVGDPDTEVTIRSTVTTQTTMPKAIVLHIGPEGGWDDRERAIAARAADTDVVLVHHAPTREQAMFGAPPRRQVKLTSSSKAPSLSGWRR